MSYDLGLHDPVSGEMLQLNAAHAMRGGTYCLGGTIDASLNVTYNYARLFRFAFEDQRGIRTLYGISGAESIQLLERAIANLGDNTDEDYWAATEGNAKRALYQLMALARLRPD